VKELIIVPVDQLNEEPYSSVLCFPNAEEAEVQRRLKELRSLGVTALEFSGSACLFGVGLPVLGKGFVGIVVAAYMDAERVAVKIRRTDADRADLLHEARMLSIANTADVAPKFVGAGRNFLVMQLVEGEVLPDWLKKNRDEAAVKVVLGDVLEQCYRLDKIGLDHGELSKAPKHLLVDKAGKAFIVDFETASVERRVANVTAVCQYLFAGNSDVSGVLAEILGKMEKFQLLEALKVYKKNRTRENFEGLLDVCLS